MLRRNNKNEIGNVLSDFYLARHVWYKCHKTDAPTLLNQNHKQYW